MTKKLTNAQRKKKYLKNPHQCPYCQSDMLDAGEMNYDDENPTCVTTCSDCHRSWTDTYGVVDVEL